jgi:hypothetical protein
MSTLPPGQSVTLSCHAAMFASGTVPDFSVPVQVIDHLLFEFHSLDGSYFRVSYLHQQMPG